MKWQFLCHCSPFSRFCCMFIFTLCNSLNSLFRRPAALLCFSGVWSHPAWEPPFVNLFLICATTQSLVPCPKMIFDIPEDELCTARKKSGKWNIEDSRSSGLTTSSHDRLSPHLKINFALLSCSPLVCNDIYSALVVTRVTGIYGRRIKYCSSSPLFPLSLLSVYHLTIVISCYKIYLSWNYPRALPCYLPR